ncbi:hypothetical protein PIB30_066347 [Stylosanthes scabra]|uniref:Ubiquitin-like protease family profile domain-containing protein n=1 Tax=Stylosanthes scabra TaxID=79078 RepID=A0ABU6UMV6_9FABA|nr:hypothetical protein [Stylosanthes scabra]
MGAGGDGVMTQTHALPQSCPPQVSSLPSQSASRTGRARHRRAPRPPNPATLIPKVIDSTNSPSMNLIIASSPDKSYDNNNKCRRIMWQGFYMAFRPTVAMSLTLEDCKLATYIFGEADNIVHAACVHAAETARQKVCPRVYVLPWTFASEVLGGTPVCELDERYSRFWMPTTQTLRHVFIPVREFNDAWYLVIVDIKDHVVYALDVCRSPESMKRRKETIDTLCHAMGSIFLLDRNIMNFGRIIPDPQNFGLPVYPQGVAGDMNIDQTGLWMLYWLQHKAVFFARMFHPMGNPDHVRMRIAVNIVKIESNELRHLIEENANHA